MDMREKIENLVKVNGENDGIVSRVYLSDIRYNEMDVLSVAWSHEDEDLIVFMQDDNDTITETEWFNALPHHIQCAVYYSVIGKFGTKVENKEPKGTTMEENSKYEMLLEMLDLGLALEVDGMRDLQNEILLYCSGCKYDIIETNNEDGMYRLLSNYNAYEIVELMSNGSWNKNHKYVTIENGGIKTMNHIADYFDKHFIADFIMSHENYLNLNDFFCATYSGDDWNAYVELFIKHYVSYNPHTSTLKARKAVASAFERWNDFIYYSWNNLDDMVRTSTKEDVFDDMRNILKDRGNKTLWFDDDKRKVQQYYFGETIEHLMVSVRLVKDREGNDVILQDADIIIDGEVIREIDNVMHLNFEEMKALYNLMEQNNY